MIVVDTSVIAAFFFEEHDSDLVHRAHVKDKDWVAPPLWRSEFQNVLVSKVRGGATDREGALLRYRLAKDVVATKEPPSARLVLDLALEHGLSAYDATYTALARTLGIILVTFDSDFTGPGLGLHPKDFLDV